MLLLRGKGALVTVAAVLLATALVSFARTPLLPDIARDLSLAPASISAITAAFALARLAVDLPVGRAVDRLPTSLLLSAVGALLCAGSITVATAHSLTHVLAGVLIVGVASSIVNITGMVRFSAHASAANRGRSMAAFSILLLTAQVIGPIFGGALGGSAGWRTAQIACAAIGLCIVAACLLLRVGPSGGAEHPSARGEISSSDLGWTERLILGGCRFVVFFSVGALTRTLIPLIGASALGLSASAIGLALGLGGVARFFGTSAVGFVSDRVSRKAALVPSLTVVAVGAGILAMPASAPVWVASIVLLTAGSAGMAAAAAMVGDRVAPSRLGAELSGFRFLGDIGMLVGPLLTGVLYGYGGRVPAMLMVSILLLTCAMLVLIALRDSYHGRR